MRHEHGRLWHMHDHLPGIVARKIYRVLIADDSADDRFILRYALRRHPRLEIVGEVCDGEDAIAYLSGQTVFGDREKYPFPDLVLLDLNMPRKTGLDVLRWMHHHTIPQLTVVMLSGSQLAQDIGA